MSQQVMADQAGAAAVSSSAPPIVDVRRSPHYRDGFDDGLAGSPLHLGEPTTYVEGWLAAQECRALLEHGSIGTARREYEAWKATP